MARARLVAGVAVVLCTLFAAACGGSAGERVVVDAEDQVPPILNVLLADGATVPAQRVVSNVLQNLLTVDDEGRYVPQLAQRVPAGGDLREGPLRVTFHLRPEARWSDGEPVTARDVVFTWRTMMDPGNEVAGRSGWDRIRSVRPGVDAAGEPCDAATCLTVAFDGDYAPWRDVFSVAGGYYVLPRHILAGEDFNTVWNDGGIVGSGPYVLSEYHPRVRAVLRRDHDYWDATAVPDDPVDTIVVNFLQSPEAALKALREDAAQMMSPPPDPALIARAREIPGVDVQAVPSVFFEHIIINTQAPPADDPAVRRALAYAIDRQEIADVLLEGTAPVLQSLLRPFQLGYRPVFRRYAHDAVAAARELEGAGWSRGADGIYARDGRRLVLPLVFPSEGELRLSTARLIAAQARDAGIEVRPRPTPSDRIFGPLIGEGDFTLLMAAFGGGVDPSVTGLLAGDQIPTEANGYAGQNVYRYSDARLDALLARSDTQVHDGRRAATLGRIQEIIARDVPLIPLYQQPNTVAARDSIRGIRANPSQAEVFWNSAEWAVRE